MTTFEDITNQIGIIIQNNADIQNYAQANLGGNLTVADNSIIKKEYIPDMPFCIISKEDEEAYRNNKAVATQKSNTWFGTIVFVADFSASQENNANFTLPANVRQVLNGILTNMPSDFMRVIARKTGELITEQVQCGTNTSGVYLESYSIFADDYYADENGIVASQLNFEVSKRNNFYS